MFMGTYEHGLDAKGRVIIPAKLREDLGESFVVTLGLDPVYTHLLPYAVVKNGDTENVEIGRAHV